MLSDRSVYVPGWLDAPLVQAATAHAGQFEKEHRVVMHELLRNARQAIRTAEGIRGTIEKGPTLSPRQELVFRINLQDTEVVLHVSRRLIPCQIHLANGEPCDANRLFDAYDLALEYMQNHVEEIERMGFDTSELRLSVQDWLGYRERMRLV